MPTTSTTFLRVDANHSTCCFRTVDANHCYLCVCGKWMSCVDHFHVHIDGGCSCDSEPSDVLQVDHGPMCHDLLERSDKMCSRAQSVR